jgi:hypothetical protein
VPPVTVVVPKVELAAALAQPVKEEAAATAEVKEDEEEGEDEPSWPPPGIVIVSNPDGISPGTYRLEKLNIRRVRKSCKRRVEKLISLPFIFVVRIHEILTMRHGRVNLSSCLSQCTSSTG